MECSLEEIYYTACPPYPDAVETLVELSNQGHEIYYITARPKEHGERTKKWMIEQGFPVQDDRFFCGMKDQEKVEIIQSLQLDYYFDDKPDVLNTLTSDQLRTFCHESILQPASDHSKNYGLVGIAKDYRKY